MSGKIDPKNSVYNYRTRLKLLGLAFIGLGIWYWTPISDYLVDIVLIQVPLEADIELGRQSLKEFPYRTIYHPKWTPWIQSIGQKLIASSPAPSTRYYQWDFGVVEWHVVNAFALPGGVVRVTTTLLQQLDLTEGEMAALLGHEMGHVLHRHSQARIVQEQLLGYVLQALVYEDHDDQQESFGQAVGELLLRSANWLGQQSFSRKDEYEADATSWDLLQNSNLYHPRALQSLLEKLWAIHGRQGGKTSWENTHPGTLDRIQALDEKWNRLRPEERRRLTRNTIR